MKHKRYTSLLLLAPALLAFTPRSAEVSYGPAAGTTLTKTFETSTQMTLDDMTMVMNGQEMDASQLGMEMSSDTTTTITVTDSYEAMADGQVTKLVRSFDELSMTNSVQVSNTMMPDTDTDLDGSSDLEGLEVVFTWNEESGEYEVAFSEDSGGDEELLDGLEQDMDLSGLLPSEEVSEGSTWEVDPQAIRALLAPGGSLKLEVEVEESPMGMGPQPSPDQYIGDLEGDVTAGFSGIQEKDGVQVAVIDLEINVVTANDLTDVMSEMMENAPAPGGMEMEMDVEAFDMEFTLEAEGQLYWNLATGTVHSLEISGDAVTTMDTSMNMSVSGQELSMEQTLSMSGTTTLTVSTSNDDEG